MYPPTSEDHPPARLTAGLSTEALVALIQAGAAPQTGTDAHMPAGAGTDISIDAHQEAAIAATTELYERLFPMLIRMAQRRYHPTLGLDDVEDIVQTTFVRLVLLNRLAHYTAGNFEAWIVRCVHNACRNYLRQAGREEPVEEMETVYTVRFIYAVSAEEEALTVSTVEGLLIVLKELLPTITAHELDVLYAYIVADFNVAETARCLARTPAQVSRILYKIRRRAAR